MNKKYKKTQKCIVIFMIMYYNYYLCQNSKQIRFEDITLEWYSEKLNIRK